MEVNISDPVEIKKRAIDLFDLIDDYLIGDLKAMANIPAGNTGGVGYPMIQSILSGMELLGMCLSGGRERDVAFYYFWDNYLVKRFPEYQGLKQLFYVGIRHSTAHFFLTRAGIAITKAHQLHLRQVLSRDGSVLNIDVLDLFDHFVSCYEDVKQTILTTQEEKTLKRFDQGHKKLLDQIRRGEQEVEKAAKQAPKLDLWVPGKVVQSSIVACDVNRSTIVRPADSSLSGTVLKNPNERH